MRRVLVVTLAGMAFWAIAAAVQAADADPRVKFHRTLADLIEAQTAAQPDQAKIDKLTKELQELQPAVGSRAVLPADRPAPSWGCPRGGPGWGCGQGYGRGYGRGFGPGGGMGRGAAFVDNDRDGLCDNYEVRRGLHR